jgi:hypothetical protein
MYLYIEIDSFKTGIFNSFHSFLCYHFFDNFFALRFEIALIFLNVYVCVHIDLCIYICIYTYMFMNIYMYI